MPNYVRNSLTVIGPEKSLIKLRDDIRTEDEEGVQVFDFNRIIPMPEDLSVESGSTNDSALAAYAAECGCKDMELKISGYIYKKYLPIYGMMHKSSKDNPEYAAAKKRAAEIRAEWEKKNPGAKVFADAYGNSAFNYDDYPSLVAFGHTLFRNIDNYGCETWYEWRNEKWGTKWNACGAVLLKDVTAREDGLYELGYEFQTAWSLPAPIYIALTELYTDLAFIVEYENEDFYEGAGTIALAYEHGVVGRPAWDVESEDEDDGGEEDPQSDPEPWHEFASTKEMYKLLMNPTILPH